MTAAITVLLLVVGLPVAAWWLGSRRFWDRQRGRSSENDPWGDWIRRHGLSTAAAVRVSRAVSRGEELTGSRLREAAVDWAHVLQQPVRPRTARRRRLLIGLLGTYALAVGSFVAYRLLTGHPGDVNWVGLVAWTAFGVWGVRRRRNIRRSLLLNGGAPNLGNDQP